MDPKVTRLFDIPDHQLLHYPQPDCLAEKQNGQWQKYSTEEIREKYTALSLGLIQLGVRPGDKVALIANNRVAWNICDLAILQIGAISVPIYPTISEKDYQYIFNDAAISYCFVADQELHEKVARIAEHVESLQGIYTFDEVTGAKHWDKLFVEKTDDGMQALEKRRSDIQGTDLATIIYTSGTTGEPKGVMLSHQNIVSNALACIPRLPVTEHGKALSFLPLCHVYERMLVYLYMLQGVSVYYAESMETIGDNLKEVKPDVFTAVPRLLEKVYDKIMQKGHELSGIKRALFFWAVGVGEKYDPARPGGWFYQKQLGIARKLIFSKWQEALGGNAKAIASGSAALQPRLARIYLAAGIPVMEGYGLSETSPVVAVNCEENDGVRIGTVGRAIEGVSIKLAEDGEILVKGPNVMMGYYNKPEITQTVIDADGWFHTGDIGAWTDGDFLKITDRKKEIFKTSGGKYIAPQPMENAFKSSIYIEQIMVVGEGQKHPSALIVPNFEALQNWCATQGVSNTDPTSLCEDENVIKLFQKEVSELNQGFGKWEQIKKFKLLPTEWSIENGELTPTLKLKRKILCKKFENDIAAFYQ